MAYDVFFLSKDESDVQQNLSRLLEFCPYAKHVHGVVGILQAHQACASRSSTEMFWVIDADNWVLDFDFNFKCKPQNLNQVHLWYSRNSVNGLEYGYGGIKLLPKQNVLNMVEIPELDMTRALSKNLILDTQVASITKFNTDEFSSYRSGFRESIKLCKKIKEKNCSDSQYRLTVWSNVGLTSNFGQYCILGSRHAMEYFSKSTSLEDLKKINDYNWLKSYFEEHS